MISKNLFFKLEKEEWKRKLWLAALAFLAFFFALPVGMALNLSNTAERYDEMVESGQIMLVSRAESLTQTALNYVSASENGMMIFLVMVSAVVCGAASFSYLHNKKKVDFYHSIPVKRPMIFSVAFLVGILIPAAAYALNLLVAVGVAAGYSVSPGEILPLAAEGWAFHMLYFWFLYSVTVLAMMMTGNLVVGLLGTMVFFLYFPALGAVISGYFSTFFKTYLPLAGERRIMDTLGRISPASLYLMAYNGLQSGEGTASLIVASVIAAAAVTALSVLLYQKRPSEAAGKAMAFPASRPVIRIALVVLLALSGGLFFWSLHSANGWAVFGVVTGAVLCHCIVEIIYHFDFRKLFTHKLQLAVCTVASLSVLFCFKNDWLGYDAYLPEADQVAEAAIDLGNDYWISYDQIVRDENGTLVKKYRSDLDYQFEQMKITDLQPVLEIASKGIEYSLKEEREDQGEEYWTVVSIQYTLSNGRKVQRRYNMPLSEAMDAVKELWQNAQFQEGKYPILSMGAEEAVRAEYRVSSSGTTLQTAAFSSKEQVEELLQAYQEELRMLDIETMEKENPVAQIRFLNEAEAAYADEKRKNDEIYDSWVQDCAYYPIYPSFTRTLELMEQAGIDPETVWDNVQVEEITIEDSYAVTEKGSSDLSPSSERYVFYQVNFRSQEEIEEILQTAVLGENFGMNWLAEMEFPEIYITIRNENGSQETVSAKFPKGEIPDFVSQALAAERENERQ